MYNYLGMNGVEGLVAGLGLSEIITSGLAIMITLLLKDFFTEVAIGLRFYFNPAFMPGDIVYINGVKFKLLSVGFRRTVLENLETKRWVYYLNSKIVTLPLEKDFEED